MKLFQYKWEDESVSIVGAEDKEEAYDMLLEVGYPDIEILMPMKYMVITLRPKPDDEDINWELESLALNTFFELPVTENLPSEVKTVELVTDKKEKDNVITLKKKD